MSRIGAAGRARRRELQAVQGLSGERALLVAVIAQATADLQLSGRPRHAALAYFAGAEYRRHLDLIGLPAGWLPVELAGPGMGGQIAPAGSIWRPRASDAQAVAGYRG